MARFFSLIVCALLLVCTSGCSLFSFKINAKQTPETNRSGSWVAPSDRYSTASHLLTVREFGQRFSQETEKSADALASLAINDEQHHAAILWKEQAQYAMNQIMAQEKLDAILVDAWRYSLQTEQYFSQGAANHLFARQQYIPIGTARNLRSRIERIAKEILPANEYAMMQRFIQKNMAKNNRQSGSLAYQTSYRHWLAEGAATKAFPADEEINGDRATMASISGVPAHAVKQAITLASQTSASKTPLPTTTQASYTAQDTAIIKEALTALTTLTTKLQGNMVTNRNVQAIAMEVASALEPISDSIDKQTEMIARGMIDDRANTDAIIRRERIAFGALLSNERKNLLDAISKTVENQVERFWVHLAAKLPNILMYIILIVIVAFLTPFLLGYFIGKKQRDPNYTVITTLENRKILTK